MDQTTGADAYRLPKNVEIRLALQDREKTFLSRLAVSYLFWPFFFSLSQKMFVWHRRDVGSKIINVLAYFYLCKDAVCVPSVCVIFFVARQCGRMSLVRAPHTTVNNALVLVVVVSGSSSFWSPPPSSRMPKMASIAKTALIDVQRSYQKAERLLFACWQLVLGSSLSRQCH
jgi:hypothetical protein